MKISKRTVDTLAASEEQKDKIYWDEEVSRFGIRVSLGRKKTYLIQYRNAQGSLRKQTIGTHGTWTPDTAREEAKRLLRLVDSGGDPLKEKAETRAALTVEQLCQRYLEDCERGLVLGRRKKPKKESTKVSDRGRIIQHIIPLLGKKLARDLVRADVKEFMDDVAIGRTAKTQKTAKLRGKAVVTGGHGTARRTVGLLGGIFSYAEEHSIVGSNPVRGVTRSADGKREFRLSLEEYRKLGQTLNEAEASQKTWQLPAIIRLLALTGCRLSEIVALKKKEVDLSDRCLRLADNKMRGAFIPLGKAAARILANAMTRTGDECIHVFPGVRKPEQPFGGFARGWEKVIGKAYTAHGLRHAFASSCDGINFSEITIAALLGHTAAKEGSTTRGYIHKPDPVLLAAADQASQHIHDAMSGRVYDKAA